MTSESMPPEDPLEDPTSDDRRGFVPDFVRRMAWAGLGAVFMSEETIRRVASQLKLPKEVLTSLLSQAEKTKDEVGRVVTEEVRKVLQSDRLRDEFLKMLAGMTIEVKAEVKLVPDRVRDEDKGLMPRVKVSELKTRYGGPDKPPRDGD